MVTIPIKKIENTFGLTLYKRKGMTVLGLDTASTTGYALIRISHNQTLRIETNSIKVKGNRDEDKYNLYIDVFSQLIKPHYKVIVEDTFMGVNARGFKQITRIGGIAYTIAKLKGCDVRFLMATQARKRLGLKGNAKKKDLQKLICDLLEVEISHDETDAVILALNGLIK